jgi:hypothetical protein
MCKILFLISILFSFQAAHAESCDDFTVISGCHFYICSSNSCAAYGMATESEVCNHTTRTGSWCENGAGSSCDSSGNNCESWGPLPN